MKTKDYIKEFKLENGWINAKKKDPSLQVRFFSALINELSSLLEANKVGDNIKGFNNYVRQINFKWVGISNKIPYGLSDGLWKCFYATFIIPLRKSVCPNGDKSENERYEQRKRQREEHHRLYDNLFSRYDNMFNEGFFLFLKMLKLSSAPSDSFEYFGLSSDCTSDEVLVKFKQKTLLVHPDRGGSNELMTECIENRNKCLSWCKQNNQ